MGACLFRLGFIAAGGSLLLQEFVYVAQSVNKLHFAGKERVAFGTDIQMNFFLGRACSKFVSADTGDGSVSIVGWVNI